LTGFAAGFAPAIGFLTTFPAGFAFGRAALGAGLRAGAFLAVLAVRTGCRLGAVRFLAVTLAALAGFRVDDVRVFTARRNFAIPGRDSNK